MKKEDVKSLIVDWIQNPIFDAATIEAAALSHAKSECEKYNSKCGHCGAEKSPDEFSVLTEETVDSWFYGFWKYQPDKKLRINVCNKCTHRWLYKTYDPSEVKFKKAAESLDEDISKFIERVNTEIVNSRANPYDMTDDLPSEAVPHIKADYIHLMNIPLEVIYYFAHHNHQNIRHPEEIFQEQYLSDPDGEFIGRFKPEIEEILIKEYAIKPKF